MAEAVHRPGDNHCLLLLTCEEAAFLKTISGRVGGPRSTLRRHSDSIFDVLAGVVDNGLSYEQMIGLFMTGKDAIYIRSEAGSLPCSWK